MIDRQTRHRHLCFFFYNRCSKCPPILSLPSYAFIFWYAAPTFKYLNLSCPYRSLPRYS